MWGVVSYVFSTKKVDAAAAVASRSSFTKRDRIVSSYSSGPSYCADRVVPVADIVPVRSLGTDGINQSGDVRRERCRSSA